MQRPKRGETEEDLLKLQKEFMKSDRPSTSTSVLSSNKRRQEENHGNKSSESARDIVKMEGLESSDVPSSSHPTPSKKSKFNLSKNVQPSKLDDDVDVEEMMDRKETGLAVVLTTIIERDTRNQMISAPIPSRQAFPSVLRNETLSQTPDSQSGPHEGGRKKKKSLFAQHVEAKSAREFGVDRPAFSTNPSSSSAFGTDTAPSLTGPCLIDGKGLSASNSNTEAHKIHEENLDRIQSMSEEDILEERSKLLQSIDPKVLDYLKKRKQEKQAEISKSDSSDGSSQTASYSVQKARKNQKSGKKDSELSLPVKPEKGWMNMDVVEKDKLKWMEELPPPNSISSETGKSARFDFDGNLLAIDEDVPVNAGLHHHGDEPERAGYSLQELFILARSSNLQQRILSLHSLAKIIRKAKCGDLSAQTEGPIIPILLDGGLVLLLRWALDDSVEGVVYAAVDALHALLWSPLDEEAVDSQWPTFLGHLSVALTPSLTLEKWAEPPELDEENKEEETDGDMMKRDVVEALVKRTHLLTRCSFILESMRPQAPVVVKLLCVLCRIAQHSSSMAYEIFKCPGLMDKVVKEFLPTAWCLQDPFQPTSDVYGLPVPSAMRLMRCLAQTGKNITASLISKFHLLTVLLRYLAVNTRDLHLPVIEASNMKRESLCVWKVIVSFGLGTQTFFDLYEVIVRTLGKVEECWVSPKQDVSDDVHSHMTCLVSVLETVVCGVTTGSNQGRSEKESSFPSLPINWSHVTNLFEPIRLFMTEALKTVGATYPTQKQDLALPTACLNFLASFYDVENKQSGLDQVSRLAQLESLCNDCLMPFLSSYGLAVMIEHLGSYSNVLLSSWSSPSESSSNLPSLNVFCESKSIPDNTGMIQTLNISSLMSQSPLPFLVSLYRLVLSMCKRHKALIAQLLPPLVDNKDLKIYMKKVCQVTASPLGSSHWTRTENLLHYYWLKACLLKPCLDMTLAHRVSIRLMSRLPKGDEFLIHDLMTSVIFSPMFIVEGQESNLTSDAISSLSLSKSLYLKSAIQEDIDFSKSQLLRQAYESMAAIRGHFIQALSGMEQAVTESRNLHTASGQGIQRLTTSCDLESLMPVDWIYLPLIHVYNKGMTLKSVPGSEITSKDIAMVTSVLQWTYLLETWRSKEVESISLITRLSRIMCAFIAGNEMFLEKGVQKYLAGLFREMTSQRNLDRMNPEEKVPGISSFYDFYQEFLDHYESVSFGDPVFGLYVLLPLQQRFSSLYRKAVWGERRKILRTLRVPLQQMLIPVENFLHPDEGDLELLSLYVHAILSGSLQQTWSPVLYLVAIHHINRFLFVTHDDGNAEMRERLWKSVAANYQKHSILVYYKTFNPARPDGLERYQVLPNNRQEVCNRHM